MMARPRCEGKTKKGDRCERKARLCYRVTDGEQIVRHRHLCHTCSRRFHWTLPPGEEVLLHLHPLADCPRRKPKAA